MSKASEKRARKAEAIEFLKKELPPGSLLYSVLRSVSRDGMNRRMDFYTFTTERAKGGTRLRAFRVSKSYLTSSVAAALGLRHTLADWQAGKGALVGGCGMDMGFHVANSLSYLLHEYPKDGGDVKGLRRGYTIRHEWI